MRISSKAEGTYMPVGKAVALGVIIGALALGAIGAAFATGMDFSNVGVLSSGEAEVPCVNSTSVGFVSNETGAYALAVAFDRTLRAGSSVWIELEYDRGNHGRGQGEGVSGCISGYLMLPRVLNIGEEAIVPLCQVLPPQCVDTVTHVTISVAER